MTSESIPRRSAVSIFGPVQLIDSQTQEHTASLCRCPLLIIW